MYLRLGSLACHLRVLYTINHQTAARSSSRNESIVEIKEPGSLIGKEKFDTYCESTGISRAMSGKVTLIVHQVAMPRREKQVPGELR